MSISGRRFFPAISILIAAVTTTGCYIPLTRELIREYHLTEAEVKDLQYYVSHDVLLRREVPEGGREITKKHTLRVINGKLVEEILLKKHTPGVALEAWFFPGDPVAATLAVSFETSDNDSLLFTALDDPHWGGESSTSHLLPDGSTKENFVINPTDGGNTKFEKFFMLNGASHWSYSWVQGKGNVFSAGTVEYGGFTYNALKESYRAHLLLKKSSLEKFKMRRKVLPGRRL